MALTEHSEPGWACRFSEVLSAGSCSREENFRATCVREMQHSTRQISFGDNLRQNLAKLRPKHSSLISLQFHYVVGSVPGCWSSVGLDSPGYRPQPLHLASECKSTPGQTAPVLKRAGVLKTRLRSWLIEAKRNNENETLKTMKLMEFCGVCKSGIICHTRGIITCQSSEKQSIRRVQFTQRYMLVHSFGELFIY